MSAASLAVFRMTFGVAMVANALLYMPVLVREYYVEPDIHFPYGPLTMVRPPPGDGLYLVYALMVLMGALIAVGRWYRTATWSFFLLTTYVFLLDSTHYQNHEYLISLLSLMLALLPAQCRWSLDARRHPELASATVPAWIVWLLRFQVGVPYFFGGVAKLNGDWLRGEPLRQWLAERSGIESIHVILTTDWVMWTMVYGALVLDLSVVWLLLRRSTRLPAFAVATCFHMLNAWLFGLFVFPWLMIAATTIFFPPEWPERFARGRLSTLRTRLEPSPAPSRRFNPSPFLLAFFAMWVAAQAIVPLRHYAFEGSPSWTEQGHRFAWHMKLRDKAGSATFIVSTPEGERRVDPLDHLSSVQVHRLVGHPERLVYFAQHLSREHDGAPVRAETAVSLNGRPRQPIVSPDVDLSSVTLRWWKAAPWILPLEHSLPSRSP